MSRRMVPLCAGIATSLLTVVAVVVWSGRFAIPRVLLRSVGESFPSVARSNETQASWLGYARLEMKFGGAVSENSSAVANDSLGMLEGGVRVANNSCPKVPFNTVVIDHGVSQHLPAAWGACGLVGSGQLLKDAGLGAFIDLHTTVIRMNRVITPHFERDLGRKTTVYFKNTLADYNGSHAFVRYLGYRGAHNSQNLEAGGWCHIASGGEACPFDSVLWEGSLKKDHWKVGVPTAFPIAHQTPVLNLFQHNMKVLGYHHFKVPVEHQNYFAMPSAGAKALLTALMVCDTVTMFGFGGAGTIDNHGLAAHDVDAEHRFEARLIRGDVSVEDFPTDFHGNYSEEFRAFRDRIVCMSKDGLIRGTIR